MNRVRVGPLALGICLLCVLAAGSQPPPGKDKGPGNKEGPPGGPPRPFELGWVLPPHVRPALKLTKDQEKKIAELEKEVKKRLETILTNEQKRTLKAPPPPPPGAGGQGRLPENDNRPDRIETPKQPEKVGARDDATRGGIQWFATWESGLREAQRTGRPILLVAAAPHCGGVSGIW